MNTINITHRSGNATGLVKQAILKLSPNEENILRFEKGTYYFYAEGAYCGDFYPSNNMSGRKTVVFPILDMHNLTIDGNGSQFIFCDRLFPFIIQNSSNITLKNFDIDFSFPRHCQAVVKSSDTEGFELTIDKNTFDYYIKDGNLCFDIGKHTASTKEKRMFIKDFYNSSVPVAYLFAGDTEDTANGLPARALMTDAIQTDTGVYFKYRSGSEKIIYPISDEIFIGNDEDRENDVIFAELSQALLLENINIYRGAGMGMIAQLCTDITVDGIGIMPKSDRDNLLSVTADGLHFVNCDGKLVIKNSRIEKSVDDAINIHGVYSVVKRILSPYSAEICFGHKSQNGLIPFLKGDTAYISELKDGEEKGSAVVTNVSFGADRSNIVLEFDRDISSLLHSGSLLENPGRMPEVFLENNIVYDCPHMRISSSNPTIIRNNTLSLSCADIYIADLFKEFWYESGAAGDVLITENTFLSDESFTNIKIQTFREGERIKKHKSIVIEKNTFAHTEEKAISADVNTFENILMRNNKFGGSFI